MASRFGVLGDIHGNFAAVARILDRHPDVPFWLCVGDVATVRGDYPQPQAPIYWIKGNNEQFDRIARFAAGDDTVPNLHFVPNGQAVTIEGVTVAGLGGTFAPTWYERAASELPHTPKDDKRRHFVRAEVAQASRLTGVDVLLTHEAPTPFWIELPSSRAPGRRVRRDVGKAAITELADALRPRLHCFGHHHQSAAFTRNGIATRCVDRVNRSYLLVDTNAWTVTEAPTGDD